MTAEIRTVAADEIRPWVKTMRTGLMANPGDISEATMDFWRSVWQPERAFGAYDGGRCVGTLRTFPTSYTVPAGPGRTAEISCDALTQVSVAATHRRQGLLRGMLTRSLANAKDRGETVSLLRAAEWGIYGRFGYWPVSQVADYTVSTAAGPALRTMPSGLTVVQVDPAEALEPASALLRAARLQEHGQIDRPLPMWRRALRLHNPAGAFEPVCLLARTSDGTAQGFLMWTGRDGDWYHDPLRQVEITVDELIAVTPEAYAALWHYLINIDLVRTVKFAERAVDEPLPWLLTDGRAIRQTVAMDGDWMRILDLPAAVQARRYAVADRLVLDIHDPDGGGYAAGRWVLDGGPEHAECRPSTANPDLRLSQRALSAIYLGGASVRSQQVAGLIDEDTPGA
ncbi:MAG TPA: GNAT family N-acetyltransferase, partial [Jatrophihabitans sp.]|nr:GNAT family N-acetyltransferase [Jatrophihabitans sp.]